MGPRSPGLHGARRRHHRARRHGTVTPLHRAKASLPEPGRARLAPCKEPPWGPGHRRARRRGRWASLAPCKVEPSDVETSASCTVQDRALARRDAGAGGPLHRANPTFPAPRSVRLAPCKQAPQMAPLHRAKTDGGGSEPRASPASCTVQGASLGTGRGPRRPASCTVQTPAPRTPLHRARSLLGNRARTAAPGVLHRAKSSLPTPRRARLAPCKTGPSQGETPRHGRAFAPCKEPPWEPDADCGAARLAPCKVEPEGDR